MEWTIFAPEVIFPKIFIRPDKKKSRKKRFLFCFIFSFNFFIHVTLNDLKILA